VQSGNKVVQGKAWMYVHLNGQTQMVRLPVLHASNSVPSTVGGVPFKIMATVPTGYREETVAATLIRSADGRLWFV